MDPRQACLDCLAQEPPALFEAALWIAAEHLPAYSPAHALRELDELVRQIGASLDDRASASERAQGLLRRMSEQGFCEDDDFPLQPRSALLPLVLQRRQGQPLSLALVAMELARRLDIPLVGVNFPGRFLLRVPQADHLLDPATGRRLYTPRLPRTAAAPARAEERAASRLPEAGLSRGNPPASVAQPATTAQRRRRAAGRAEGCPAGDRTRPGGRRRPRGPRRPLSATGLPAGGTLRPGARALAQRRSHRATAPRPAPGRTRPADRPRPALRPLRRAGRGPWPAPPPGSDGPPRACR